MRQVREGLFLGDIMDCIAVLQTPESKITHILSVFADELLVGNQNFVPGNLCSLCKGDDSADDDAPAATTAGTPQDGAPLLTIPTRNPTNPESLDDTGRGPEVSQDATSKVEGNAKAVESSASGSGTDVRQDAMVEDEGNAKAVKSSANARGTEVRQHGMAKDEGNAKAVESSANARGTEVRQHAMANDDGVPKVVGNGTQVSLRDAMANDDGNVKVVESPVGNAIKVSDRDAMANDGGNAKAVESAVGNAMEASGQDAMANDDGNVKVVESPVGNETEVSVRDAMATDDGNAKAVESPAGNGTKVTLRDAMGDDDGTVKVVESPVGNGTKVTLRDAISNDGENAKVVEFAVGNRTEVTLRDAIANDDENANAVESSSGGAVPEVGGGAQIANNEQEAVGAKRELVRKTVPLRDMESQNLLDHLEVCLEFVEKGRASGGAVLVHCLAGISRSASVITAYLMRTEELSLYQALASLREVSKGVRPNDGFMAQLQMFEEMGCRVDKKSPIYKQFQDTSFAQGAGCTPGLSWLSFLDYVSNNNRVQKEDSFRRPSFIKRVYNVARPIKEKGEENKVSADTPPSGVSSFRVGMGRLCRSGF